MEYGIIKKENIGELLAAAQTDYAVYAPVMGPSEPEFKRLDKSDQGQEIVLDYQNIKLSPKGVFFPQTETLLTYDNDTIENIPIPEEKYLVFGSRPCDAVSLIYLDKIFSPENKGYNDPYYMKRREEAVMISVSCNTPCTTCFCTSVGGGPGETTGSDIVATLQDETYLFHAVTEKGKAFMKSQASQFTEAGKDMIDQAAKTIEEAAASMTVIPVDQDGIKKIMDDHFNSSVWHRMTQNCIGCGACTYLCPTCYCFDIADEGRMYKGKRIRTWDSCQYGKFTMHASGHNPRNTKTERLRQRFMHKFSYTVENTGDIFCVGCGRCITNCPVNLDIREVIQAFADQ